MAVKVVNYAIAAFPLTQFENWPYACNTPGNTFWCMAGKVVNYAIAAFPFTQFENWIYACNTPANTFLNKTVIFI